MYITMQIKLNKEQEKSNIMIYCNNLVINVQLYFKISTLIHLYLNSTKLLQIFSLFNQKVVLSYSLISTHLTVSPKKILDQI